MKTPLANNTRIRLACDECEQLRLQTLERDGWRCQHCGKRDHLEIHHIIRRSQSGADSEENLIALCGECHGRVHRSPRQMPGPLSEGSSSG